MKKLFLLLSLSFSLAGAAQADGVPSTPTATARFIANALQLNEDQYLKIKKIESARLEELKAAAADAKAINEKYTADIMQMLSKDQKDAYLQLAKTQPTQLATQVK